MKPENVERGTAQWTVQQEGPLKRGQGREAEQPGVSRAKVIRVTRANPESPLLSVRGASAPWSLPAELLGGVSCPEASAVPRPSRVSLINSPPDAWHPAGKSESICPQEAQPGKGSRLGSLGPHFSPCANKLVAHTPAPLTSKAHKARGTAKSPAPDLCPVHLSCGPAGMWT